MKLEDLLIVSFDGLNRAGKGTQIKLLGEHFKSKDYLVEVLRGDGSRPGLDSSGFYDPVSIFWQQWQKMEKKSLDDWTHAANVLLYENYLRCIEVSAKAKKKDQKGIVLLDRSHLSRWYMLRKQNSFLPFESCLKELTVHPNVYFVLDVPKEVLLTRNSDDNSEKAEFRRKVILTSYDHWIATLELVPEQIKIYRLDGTKKEEEIHNEIKWIVNKAIYD